MKAAIIGSGVGGLTAAALLAKAGHRVTVYEQWPHVGGVTASLNRSGFRWDLGPLLIAGLAPHEPVGRILARLGLTERVRLFRGDRTYVFPDFRLEIPDQYEGPYWRREALKRIFPEEAGGLDRYYRLHARVTALLDRAARLEWTPPWLAPLQRAQLVAKFLPLWSKRRWNARQLMDRYFRSPRLQAVFLSILADFVVRPDEFQGLGIPAVNPEAVFDRRLPLDAPGAGSSHHYIAGGCEGLVAALAETITAHGGTLRVGCPVRRIVVENGAVRAVVADDAEPADAVFLSGGAREGLLRLVGKEHVPAALATRVAEVPLMESVLMVHLGVDFDPRPYQRHPLYYYYGTYDIERGVADCRSGRYHEGRDGFLIYVPSLHSPEMAPPGCHAVTIYTVAPNRLISGTWEERGEELADRLVAAAERFVPGLRAGTRTRVVVTPHDFKARTFLSHHSFGGLAPVSGRPGVPHRTGVGGLWFIGSQSESGAGVGNVMLGAWRAARRVTEARS